MRIVGAQGRPDVPAVDHRDGEPVATTTEATRHGPICTRWELALGIGLVGLLTLVFFAPVFDGKTLSNVPSIMQLFAPWKGLSKTPVFAYPQGDQATAQYPSIVLQTQAWRAGVLPFWNPYNLGGLPLFTNGGSGVVYPLRIVLELVVSPLVDHDVFLAFHVFAAGLFMFLLLKEFRLRTSAALLGAAGWMFASWNTIWMQLEVGLPVIAGLPAALLLIHRAFSLRSWRMAAAAGIPLGFMAIGGQLGLAGFAYAICAGYSVALALTTLRDRDAPRWFDPRRFAYPALTVGVGVGLAAITLLPTLLIAAQGGRQAESYASFVVDHTISVKNFSHVLSPGPPTIDTFFAGGVYVGVVPFLLAFIGFFRRRPGAALARWLAVGMFLFAIGAPVIAWPVYHLIPTISRLTTTGYLLWAFDLGVLILAALGLDLILDWSVQITRRLRFRHLELARLAPAVAAVIGALAIGATAVQVVHYAQNINPPFTTRSGALFYPVTPAIAAVERDRQHRDLASPQRLVGFGAMIGQQNLVFSLEDADGYDSTVPSRIRNLWRVAEGSSVDAAIGMGSLTPFLTLFDPTTARFDLLPRVGVTTMITSPSDAQYIEAHPARVAPLRLVSVYQGGDAGVFDIVGNPPRAWVVHGADVVPDASAALRRYTDPSFDYRSRMVVEPDQGLGSPGQTIRRGSGLGSVATDSPVAINGASFSVNTSSPGWLVTADSYVPGWRVTVNGRPASVLEANYTMRAVAVPAGRSRIVFTYRPPGFVAGLAVSVATLTGLAFVAVLSFETRRRRRRRAAAQTDRSTRS